MISVPLSTDDNMIAAWRSIHTNGSNVQAKKTNYDKDENMETVLRNEEISRQK